MTVNEVVWRQACTIKQNADNLVTQMHSMQQYQPAALAIEAQTAVIICYASSVPTDNTSTGIHDDIITQVGQLQSSVWSVLKTCVDTTLYKLARKLYDSCANLKKRLRKRLRTLVETTQQVIDNTIITITPDVQGSANVTTVTTALCT